jgi:hypothetical protein
MAGAAVNRIRMAILHSMWLLAVNGTTSPR